MSVPALSPSFSTCPCCGAEYSEAEWFALARVVKEGREIEGFDDGFTRYAMRNCPCGSTFSVEIGPSAHPGTWDLIPKEES